MPAPQTLKNHARFDPPFHFFILPMVILNFIFSIYLTIHRWPQDSWLHIWWIAMSVVFFFMAGSARASALRVQDRLIRLEERLRLAQLLPAEELSRIPELTTSQLIALRFACDEELAPLVRRALDQNLDPKTIKQSVINWRPDYERV